MPVKYYHLKLFMQMFFHESATVMKYMLFYFSVITTIIHEC